MVTRKQAQKGRELSQTRASRLCFISTSSDTASDPVLNNDTRQGTSNGRRAGPKRAAANRAVPGRAAKRRASQKSSWTESERQQECTDLNDNGSRRNEPDDPSNRFIVDCHDEVGVALDPSGSIAPADASERERQEAVNPSADDINNLKRKVWKLEEQLSKSNGRLIAVLDRHEEQVKELKRSVCQKSATIALLESCQSSVSKSSGQNPLTEVDEEYRPMMNKIRGQLRAEADDFAREVVTYDRKVIRDWRGKVEKVSGNEEEELLIDLFGEKAFVAKCPMRLASEGEFFTKPAKQQQLLQEIIKSFVHEDIGMNEQEKIRCISRLSRTKYLTQWWGRVLSEQHSKCKTAFISTFLGTLGYYYIRKNIKPKPDQVSEVMKEQKHARSTLRHYDENKMPKFDFWRTVSVADIQYEFAEQEEEFEKDLFFKSKAARDAFLAYRGHEHEHDKDGDSDATILSLARVDAWMFVYIDVMKEDGTYGRGGGSRSDDMKKLFKRYLPQALENILRTCRLHVAEHKSAELVPVVGSGELLDRYGNKNRALTTAFRMPSSGLDYLAIRPEYFRKAICPSMGLVKDCYIGRCKPKSKLFAEIRQNDLVHDEASDEEFDGVEEEELVDHEEESAVSR